jgi:hypothetical protein
MYSGALIRMESTAIKNRFISNIILSNRCEDVYYNCSPKDVTI